MKTEWKKGIKENRSLLKTAAIIALIVLVLAVLTRLAITVKTNANDAKVAPLLQELVYTEDLAKRELLQLQEFEHLTFLSDPVRGRLFRSMAELSYMVSDDMTYNHYVAAALYYFTQTEDAESVIYVSNKYMGRLYANGCYTSAAKMRTELAEKYSIETFPPEMQASYYLTGADLAQMMNKDPLPSLNRARKAMEQMPEDGELLLSQAKYDLLSARFYINTGEFDRAEAIMAGYSETDDFGLGQGQVYVVCDFQIPYYEIMAKLQLHNQEEQVAFNNASKYIVSCEYYDFRDMKLRFLRYMSDHSPSDPFGKENVYATLKQDAADANLNEMTEKYGQFLLSDIDSTTEKLKEQDAAQARALRAITFVPGLLCLLILLLCSVIISLDVLQKDSLTRLGNRKKYDKAVAVLKKNKTPYGFLMLDIDDFKRVNDRFGHAKGDEVLASISAILLRYNGRGIFSYRFGGEELCMVFLKVPEKRVWEIAEEIRLAVENQVGTEEMRVTISGGIAFSRQGESVLSIADARLYEAKANGKNRIC